jgi:hypothetical protein
MAKCFVSKHCFLEKSVLINNVRVVIHYLPFHPIIEVSLEYGSDFGIVLFSGKFEYSQDYDSYLNFLLGDEDLEGLING